MKRLNSNWMNGRIKEGRRLLREKCKSGISYLLKFTIIDGWVRTNLFRSYRIAECLASIEGRLYLEARGSKGLSLFTLPMTLKKSLPPIEINYRTSSKS